MLAPVGWPVKGIVLAGDSFVDTTLGARECDLDGVELEIPSPALPLSMGMAAASMGLNGPFCGTVSSAITLDDSLAAKMAACSASSFPTQ